ncbi:putative protein kinase RLK-Pelle-CrRLK1L-1 family [Helianthus annuus]|nr:putative protein kinase RLK-Pelle-CrRLK1L-1 family [Helianthus annuus]
MSFLSSDAVESSSSSYSPPPCHHFAFSEIEHATQNFKESLVIGRGGFGTVYRGTISCGEILLDAAIKRLESTSNQGAGEFWGEVKTLSKLRHSHLVSLFGYCNDGKEMILVYEYMPNGTLADHLHKGRAPLTWECRLEISIGAARGLDYLHTGTGIKHGIIHRDVKSTNILLDDNWAAKISDFGLSKIGATNQQSSFINTSIKGTFGYLDPAYYQTGRLTRKSDVYAFGVVLFEVLCGKQAVDRSIDEDQWSLAAWAQGSIEKGRLKHIVDSNLRGVVSQKRLKQFAKLANRCLHTEPNQRPTMAEVVKGLESILTVREKTSGTLFSQLFVRRGPTSTFSPLPERNKLVCFEEDGVYNIDLEDLLKASAEVLGEGSFGRTYKQVLQEKKKTVAVKMLKDVVVTENEFRTRMEVLGKMKNKNVVPLIAYYYSRDLKLLVYDYMPADSLSAHLHGWPLTQLDWDHRMRISLSAARGLAYLHMAAKVVHGNIKSSNIFIQHESNNYQACLSDYGLNNFFR